MARISELSGLLGSGEEMAALRESSPDRVRFRKTRLYLAAAAGLVVALLAPLMFFDATNDPSSTSPRHYQTATAERMTVELRDGTNLVLNATSEVTLRISDRERHLTLNHGEIYLDVAHDPVRPFRVEVDTYLVTVTGTAFEVRRRHGVARLTVDEGRVVVSENEPGSIVAAREVDAGQTLVLEPGAYPVELSTQALARASSWRDGWLHFHNQRLDAVVRELEPYLGMVVVIVGEKTAALRVSGSFNADRADIAMKSLASLLPISVVYESDRIVISYEER